MQVVTYSSLSWFNGGEFFVELIFAIITLIIGFYAYKLYRLSRQKSILLFGAGFSLVSLSYFIQAILNLLLFRSIMTEDILFAITGRAVLNSVIHLSILATIFHIIFMILGLSLLSYVTLKERGTKPLLLIISLSFVALIFSTNSLIVFYVLTSIFLLFITAQHYQRHDKIQTYNTLYVFLGFLMLFIGNLQLIFSKIFGLLYLSSLIVVLIGYLLLLGSLVRVVKK